MGLAKKRMMELQERGYGEVDGYVCPECVLDEDVKLFIEKNAESLKCDFCKKHSSSKLIAAPLEGVVGYIIDCIEGEWLPVEHSGAPWDSEEKDFATDYMDFEDLLSYLGLEFSSEELRREIVNSVDDVFWARPFAETPEEDFLNHLWIGFKNLVYRKSRFVFFMMIEEEESSYDFMSVPPHKVLSTLEESVEEFSLLTTIPKGSELVRVRIHSTESFKEVKELGPPPAKFAKYPNRMSPAGITMFYGSDDEKTALWETIGNRREEGVATVATFESLIDLKLLDLTRLPVVPGFFNLHSKSFRSRIKFLHSFTKDFSRPIVKDERVHVEYVPTQIVAEYFRHVFRTNEGKIHGIRYPSAQVHGGASYVLFLGPENCVQDYTASKSTLDEPVLRLLTHRTRWKTIKIPLEISDM